MPEEFTEMSSRILAKNLEITKLTRHLDDVSAQLIDAQDKLDNLHPVWMIEVILEITTAIDNTGDMIWNEEQRYELLQKITKIGQHLSSNNSIQSHRRIKK